MENLAQQYLYSAQAYKHVAIVAIKSGNNERHPRFADYHILPTLFLLGHAIECYLKTFLSHKQIRSIECLGKNREVVRTHLLKELSQAAKANGLFSPSEDVISKLEESQQDILLESLRKIEEDYFELLAIVSEYHGKNDNPARYLNLDHEGGYPVLSSKTIEVLEALSGIVERVEGLRKTKMT